MKDQAFEWLETAYEQRDGCLIFLKGRPHWPPPRRPSLLRPTAFGCICNPDLTPFNGR